MYAATISGQSSEDMYIPACEVTATLYYNDHLRDTTGWLTCLYSGTCIYSVHPWDTTSWLLYRGGLLIQWNLYIVVTLGTRLFMAVIQRWPAYTVEPVYSGHP